ncbi:lecithin retinol acyltransferase family protein [Nostoc sp. CENA543]|uniref:lecithin retinol acyltransferase family protein n=1 Tax=Nostoc sp. CENA543 TaxID=1869241 RepID=UPI001CEF8487|nr:lecithin retinol acyltransferase family protein [Nostoc sp. CENA543]
MARGDHIYRYDDYFTVIPYTHHGIDCGDGTVIHYTEEGVLRVALHEFSQGEEIHKRHYEHSYSPDIVIWLAESRLGEREYHLVFNNCEHFANWCKTGRGESEQVKPILDIIDIFRMEKKERQSYEQRMKKQEELIKKIKS